MDRSAGSGECRPYRGVRRRRWGKWVSEIRVPGTRERLWLGSYATPEAAAVAHDAAVCLLRGSSGGGRRAGLNFPGRAAAYCCVCGGASGCQLMSPRSVQRVASDAGMAADAQLVDLSRDNPPAPAPGQPAAAADSSGGGVGGDGRREQVACRQTSDTDGSWSSGGIGSEQQLIVYGDLSVDDMEILM